MSGYDAEKVLELVDHVELEGAGRGPHGWVYFVVCADAPRCKIGFTKGDVRKRIASLQTGSPSELIMLVKHPGTPDTERRLHERFATDRLHGEWFTLSNELHAYIIATLWAMTEFALKGHVPVEAWMMAGVKYVADKTGYCSEGVLEALEAHGEAVDG